MSKNIHRIDYLFQKAIKSYEEKPPDEIWKQIENKLDTNKSRHPKLYFVKLAAACCLLLFMFATAFYLFPRVRRSSLTVRKPGEYSSHGFSGHLQYNKPKEEHKQSHSAFTTNIKGIPKLKTRNYLAPQQSKNQMKQKSGISLYDSFLVHNAENTEKREILPFICREGISMPRKPFTTSIKDTGIDSMKLIPLHFDHFSNEKLFSDGRNSLTEKKRLETDIRKVINMSRLSISLTFSPEINSYRIRGTDTGNNQFQSEFQGKEKRGFSYTAGILIDYSVTKHWKFESGVTLSSSTLLIEPSTIYAEQDDNTGEVDYKLYTSNGISKIPNVFNTPPQVNDSMQLSSNSMQHLLYGSIPLIIKYGIKNGRLTLNTFSGISINFLLNENTNVTVQKGNSQVNETTNSIEGLKGSYLEYLLGTEVQYGLNRKLAIDFKPTFRYGFTSINQNISIKTHPYSLGIGAGLTWRF